MPNCASFFWNAETWDISCGYETVNAFGLFGMMMAVPPVVGSVVDRVAIEATAIRYNVSKDFACALSTIAALNSFEE